MNNIKKNIDRYVPIIIEKLGKRLNPVILNFRSEKNRLLIFYFHGIYKDLADKKLKHVSPQNNITVDEFANFITYFLDKNYKFISSDDLDVGLPYGRPYIMITFDDGYFNNTWSLPVLQEFKVPALFFITTNNLVSNKSYWWDIVYKYRTQEGIDLTTIRKEQQYLKSLKHYDIDFYLKENFGKNCFEPWSNLDRPMTAEELKIFSSEEYVTVANHTHNHIILTNYSKTEILEEFSKSNAILEEIIGKIPKSMAFPNGNFDENILKLAKEAGFKHVFTTQNISNKLPQRQAFFLDRFMARPVPIKDYGSFLRLGYNGNTLYYGLKEKVMTFFKKFTKDIYKEIGSND